MALQRKGKACRRQFPKSEGDSRELVSGLFLGDRVIDTQENRGGRVVDGGPGESRMRFLIRVTCWEFRYHHTRLPQFPSLLPVVLVAHMPLLISIQLLVTRLEQVRYLVGSLSVRTPSSSLTSCH